MIHQLNAVLLGNCMLQFFDVFVEKLNHFAAFNVDHMVVMTTVCVGQLKHGMTAIEIMADHQPG